MWIDKSVICPVFIGRKHDLDFLDQMVKETTQHKGQIALVSGEAGQGKTRLVTELIHRAQETGIEVLKGKCFETDHSLPYAPLIDLLRTYSTNQLPTDRSRYLGQNTGELIKIYPELKTLVKGIVPTPTLEPEQEKRRIYQALEQFLYGQPNQPVLIVIEDLHWSDETSLEFLLSLARHIHTQPVLLMLTFRSDEIQPVLNHFLAEMDRERLAKELILTKLSPEDVDAMLRAIFDLDKPVRADFINTLYPLTAGNPFFIEEILKSLIMAGGIFYKDGVWDRRPIEELKIPRSVQDAVHRRVEQLSVDAKKLLTIASVVGQRFDFFILQGLTAHSDDELLTLVKELIFAQLILEESVDRFVFRHALTREAIYSQLLARERISLHKKIGDLIEQIAGQFLDPHIASLAYHFYQAEVWPKAKEYSQHAGDKALSLYSPRAAVEQFTHALDSANRLHLLSPPELYRNRGSAYARLGDFENARRDYDVALRSSRDSEDRIEECKVLLDLGLLWAGRDYSQTGSYYQKAYQLARAINDPEMLAHSLNRLGNWNVNVERPVEGLKYHAEALELFQVLGDRKGLSETFDLLGMANYIYGDLIESETHYQQAVEIFRSLNNREGLASSLASMMLNSAHLQAGMGVLANTDRAQAYRGGEEALLISREIGWRSGEAYAQIMLGNRRGIAGDYFEAFAYANTSLSVAVEIEHKQWMLYSHYNLGLLYFDILAEKHAQQHFELALDLANQIGSRWWITNVTGYLAQVYLLKKENEKAISVLEMALGVPLDSFIYEGTRLRAPTLGQRLCWLATAEVVLSDGDPGSTLRICDELIDSSTNVPGGGIIPRLWLLRGEALTALGQMKEAEETLLAAQNTAEREDEKSLLWRIYARLANLYQLQAHRDEAANKLASARGIILDLSKNILDDKLRENFSNKALGSLPELHPLTARQTAKKDFEGLTTREREVAGLITQGRSNREIAIELVVSERTVETHVENILNKLRFSSRAQIAAWVVEKGLKKGNGI